MGKRASQVALSHSPGHIVQARARLMPHNGESDTDEEWFEAKGVSAIDVSAYEASYEQKVDQALHAQEARLELQRLERIRRNIRELEGRVDEGVGGKVGRAKLSAARLSKLMDRLDELKAEEGHIIERIQSQGVTGGRLLTEDRKEMERIKRPRGEGDIATDVGVESIAKKSETSDVIPALAPSFRGTSPPSSSSSASTSDEEAEGEGFRDDRDSTFYQARLEAWGKGANISSGDVEDMTRATLDRQVLPPSICSADQCVGVGSFSTPRPVWDQLLDYQREGLRWMVHLRERDVGGILGDEMGLGKTIQAVALMATLHISGEIKRPMLVICPATVMKQWVREIQAWWPPLRVILLHSSSSNGPSKTGADLTMEEILQSVKERGHVLVTSYGYLQTRLGELLLEQVYTLVILDEGHKIRNPAANITERCKRLRTPHRFILSGTPIQNNLTELWSLMDFCYPGRLGSLTIFRTELSQPIAAGGYVHASSVQVQTAYRCACMLKDLISPFLLRRLKADVALSLPRKREQVLFCHLTAYQRVLYERYVASEDVQAIMSGTKNILAGIDILRKICNHPALLRLGAGEEDSGEEEHFCYVELDEGDHDHTNVHLRQSSNSHSSARVRGLLADVPQPKDPREFSGKMRVLDSVLKHWYGETTATPPEGTSMPNSQQLRHRQHPHRVLLFCQTRQMLDTIEDWLRGYHQEYTYLRMDGTTPIAQRSALVDRFNSDPRIFLFLLTTRVGGLGVNLTGADRVIIFDPDWNPSTDVQARERAWRLGQTRPVIIYRMLTVGTVEEKIYHRQIFKQYLTNRILSDPKQTRFFKSSDLYDLFTLGSEDGVTSAPEMSETRALLEGLHDLHEEEAPEAPKAQGDTSKNVLEGLLSVSGLHSALEHDRLIERPMREVLLVEREAQKRATEALNAIKRSREQEATPFTSQVPPVTLGASVTTASILASIRRRQLADATAEKMKVSGEGADSLLQKTVDQLLQLFGQHRGRCTSELIARTFNYISGEDAVAFRLILRTMATLQRGQWVLNPEFS